MDEWLEYEEAPVHYWRLACPWLCPGHGIDVAWFFVAGKRPWEA